MVGLFPFMIKLIMLQYFPLLGAVINLLGSATYFFDTLKGTSKPNRVTWGMWSIAPLIAAAAALSAGVRWPVLPVFMSGFVPLLIFLASFYNPKAYWKLGTFDYLCGLSSALALLLWYFTKEPIVAIIFAMASDFFAGFPTVIKSWRFPYTETGLAYVAGLLSCLTAFPAITRWTFSAYGFPLYLVFMNTLLLTSVFLSRRLKVKSV